jgi:type I restriction enzyme S subunit
VASATPLGISDYDRYQITKLKDISVKITKGTTPTTLGMPFVSKGVNFIKSESIGADGRINPNTFAFIELSTHHKLARSQIQQNDILFSMAGVYLGKTAIVDSSHIPANTNQAVGIIRIDQSVAIARYVHFALSNPVLKQYVLNSSAQSAQPNYNLAEIGSLSIPLPPLPIQKAIAHILGTLDDRIELCRRMNETLEAMARALFKDWFIDFGPVRAKMDGREPPGLSPEIAALFPDKLVDSELGEIPEGWEVQGLDQIANYLNGLALQKYPPLDERTLPVIKIAQLRKGDIGGADLCGNDVPSEYIISDGDVLFSWSGSLEVEIWCGGIGALNQHLFKVTSNRSPKWYYYLWTKHHLDEFRLIAAGKATTMGHIQRGHLTSAKVIVPSKVALDAMDVVMSPIIDQLIKSTIRARELANLRDALLPKLLSGELTIPEAMLQVEAYL